MRTLRIMFLALALIGGSNCYADGVTISPLALVGTWVGTATKPNVGEFTTNMTLTQDSQFSGTVSFQGRVILQYSGRWELQGTTLTWRYEKTNPRLPTDSMVDADNIVSVDATLLVLVSKLTGLRHEFTRKTQA
jgi:hypothetical protein